MTQKQTSSRAHQRTTCYSRKETDVNAGDNLGERVGKPEEKTLLSKPEITEEDGDHGMISSEEVVPIRRRERTALRHRGWTASAICGHMKEASDSEEEERYSAKTTFSACSSVEVEEVKWLDDVSQIAPGAQPPSSHRPSETSREDEVIFQAGKGKGPRPVDPEEEELVSVRPA